MTEPSRRIVFCENWKGSSPRYSHAAFWAKGPVRLRLTTRKPVRVTVTVDGRRVHEERLTHPAEAQFRSKGWHLVGVDAASTANGLRVLARPLG